MGGDDDRGQHLRASVSSIDLSRCDRKKGDKLVFLKNYAFNSVSAAASVVTGSQVAGTTAWRLENNKTVSYGEHERSLVKPQDEEKSD